MPLTLLREYLQEEPMRALAIRLFAWRCGSLLPCKQLKTRDGLSGEAKVPPFGRALGRGVA